jgi:hypothetical protein
MRTPVRAPPPAGEKSGGGSGGSGAGSSTPGAGAGAAAAAAASASSGSLVLPGLALLTFSALWFVAMTFALFGVHFLSREGGEAGGSGGLLATLQHDSYYALLVPLTVPVALVAVHLSWYALKLYRHS